MQQEVVEDLILEGICLSLGHGIHQLKDLKDKKRFSGFPLKRRGFGPGLQPIYCVIVRIVLVVV